MKELISAEKLQEFIKSEVSRELTPQEEVQKAQSLRLSILEQAEEQLRKAFENNNTAMVAAIAEVLNTI
ncbi:hypothetical protein [Enterococcus sp. AZ007]|uniref:hypothetical protein n=1 Tax=Enterococcus sp. AZ007 TaxID=2774839 RepID=UPI003F23C738